MREANFTKPLSLNISEDVFLKIKHITDKEKISIAEWVRAAIDHALEKKGNENNETSG